MLGTLLGSPALFAGACLLLGLIVGSFLNVVVHRLPVMLQRQWQVDCGAAAAADRFDLMAPASHCPRCKAAIAWRHNIPLLGWLWLRGRCAACKAPISARYPLLELAAGLLAAAVAVRFGPGFVAVAAIGLSLTLLVLTQIDIDLMLLPDWQALPACILVASLVGTVYGLTAIVLQGRGRQQPFPFGPFLAVAGWINLMWGEALRAAYWRVAF